MTNPVSPMRRIALLALMSCLLPAAEGQAKLILSQEEALSLAFPAGAAVEKKTAFLTPGQADEARRLARAKIESRVWTYYVGRSTDGVLGFVYFDRVIVRTLPATVMVSLGPDGSLRFVEILTFAEPDDYLPRPRWLGQFKDRILDEDLRVRGAIRNVSGATLTAHAVTSAVRRMLAVHQVVHP